MSNLLVSIIIPVCNKWELTKACIESIYMHTPGEQFEIIVMDNGSTDLTPTDLLKTYPNVKYLRKEEPIGFARANNFAASHASGELLCFLNNDTNVTSRWLEALIDRLYSKNNIVAVGPKLIYPNGTIQHAGIVFSFSKLPYHYGRFLPADHPSVNSASPFKAITGACILCRKEFYLHEKGFDEQYINGFEDIDLCLKWGQKGYEIWYEPLSTVIHLESQTPKRDAFDKENTQLYVQRWLDKIKQDDLEYYASMRGSHPAVDLIGVILDASDDLDSVHKAIRLLFSFSQSSIHILVRCKEIKNVDKSETDMIQCVSFDDEPIQKAWLEKLKKIPRFKGVVHLKSTGFVQQNWDSTIVNVSNQYCTMAGVVNSNDGFDGWLRYVGNMPESIIKSRDIEAQNKHMNTLFTPIQIFERNPDTNFTYYPNSKVDFVFSHCKDDIKVVSPKFYLSGSGRWPEFFPFVTIILHSDTIESMSDSTVKSIERILTDDVELVLTSSNPIRIDMLNDTIKSVLTKRIVLFNKTSSNDIDIRNCVALACLSNFLIFFKNGEKVQEEWISNLIMPMVNDESIGISFVNINYENIPLTQVPNKTYSAIALRREDYKDVDGIRCNCQVDEIEDLCRRIIDRKRGRILNVSF